MVTYYKGYRRTLQPVWEMNLQAYTLVIYTCLLYTSDAADE